MAMEHRGENFSAYWQGAYYRPAETLLTIQFADQLTADGGDLAGLIDVDRLAIIGASSGGWTALVGGGAQINFSGCPTFNEEAQGAAWASNCVEYAPQQDELAGMFGLSAVPDGSWPQYYDPRVDAVISIVPDGDIWGADYQGVASVTVPTTVMASSSDSVNPPSRAAYPIYEHLGSASKSMVVFEGADHPLYHDACEVAPWVADVWGLGWLCADGVWAKDLAHDLFDHFTTAFLLAELYGDEDAAAALAPDAVSFPDITYETTGF
jgi:predicted dienelactone hydrolase